MHAERELTTQGRVHAKRIRSEAHQGNDVEFPMGDSVDTMDYKPPKNKSPIHNR